MGSQESDARYETWLRWLDVISRQTYTLFLYRDYWRGLAEITRANDRIPPSTIFEAFGVWYATTQAVAVRRQLDRDPRAISLANLIDSIARHPEVMTRSRHVGLWGNEEFNSQANANYDRFAGEGKDTIDPARTNEDVERLATIATPVRGFVNTVVAHTDQRERSTTPTYEELNAAIDEIGELLKKYSSLLKATIVATVTPVHQQDWKQAFRVAWLNDGP